MGNQGSSLMCPSINLNRPHHTSKKKSWSKPKRFSLPSEGQKSKGSPNTSATTESLSPNQQHSTTCHHTSIKFAEYHRPNIHRGGSLDMKSLEELKPPAFSVEQRKLVKISWHSVEEYIAEIGLTMYLEMFKKNPETLTLFPFLKHLSKEDLEFYSQLKNHAVRVTGVLTMLITQLDLPLQDADLAMSTFLLELGRRHFSYASHPGQMELLGHTFVESLLPIFAKDDQDGLIHEAWLAFFKLIVFYMQMGFRFVQNKGQLM